MAVAGWTAVADPAPAPGSVTLPPAWFSAAGHATPYVKITLGSGAGADVTEAVLLAVVRAGAAGTQAFVLPGTLGLSSGESSPCALTPMTADQYRRWRLRQALTTGFGIWGLGLAIIGFIFDALLGVNDHAAFLPAVLAAVFAAGSPTLQIAGAILVFFQGAVPDQ